MSQFALPFEWPADPRDDEFLVSDSNARAVHGIEHWGAWPVMTALLVGPRKSGRSLLARIFAGKSGGTIIDDAERQSEAAIFHAWNRAQAERHPLLIVADAAPPEWTIKLPDLRSRLTATPVLELGPPDDVLMRALFERQFIKRGLDARPDLIDWLLTRVERSHIAVMRTVDVLDQEVLERRKRLSIPLARATLAAAALIAEPASKVDAK
ncbi:HdaA/DnaA family protein [Hephaestia mangrovi]|jgi:chromosomal replication initiation ATPase DnaA|uniref:HdaA/DnaA family protein n=1 Tax=Hephaestia mangrovi TaxID=2873268 RepID=UPI001CA7958A|nr:chromosomal replication initiator DnaA [Hephaestia mangrovi]MBY8827871.1 chromosomal replication initiator DnaA [Hephaestia mangrovi]